MFFCASGKCTHKKKSDKPVKLKGFLFLELDEIEVSALSGFDEFGEEVSERS